MASRYSPATRRLEEHAPTQAVELFEVAATQPGQLPIAGAREPEPDAPVIVRIGLTAHEPRVHGPIHEADRAVVAQQQGLRDVTDGRPPTIGVSTHREQELVLRRRDPQRLCLLFAPTEEAAELGAELEQPLVVTVGDSVGHHKIDRTTI